MKHSTSLSRYIFSASSLILVVVVWYIVSTFNGGILFPSWGEIGSSIIKIFTNEVCQNVKSCNVSLAVFWTFFRLIITMIFSAISACFIAFLYCLYGPIYSFFKPLIAIMKAAPIAIVSVYLWYSFSSNISPYIVTFFVINPIMTESFITSIDNIDDGIINELKLVKTSVFAKFFKVYIPLILPYIAMSVLQSFGLGFKVMVMSEYLCQTNNGIGKWIYNFTLILDYSYLLGFLIIIVVIVLIIEFVIRILQNKIKKMM